MSDACCSHDHAPGASPRYRRVLWVALVINAAMFFAEIAGGLRAGSVSLLADAVDFFGDAANYGISLLVLGMALAWRARAAWFKGLCMGLFGLFVLARAAWSVASGDVPEPLTMGAIGTLALLANLAVAVLLYAWRDGDANMRSVWLCTRNDAIGNVAVMGTLALLAAASVMRQARRELRPAPLSTAAAAGAALRFAPHRSSRPVDAGTHPPAQRPAPR